MDPVLHLVRNAVSHGFEPPAERRAAGKPEEGTLTLSPRPPSGLRRCSRSPTTGAASMRRRSAARARALGLAVPDGPLDDATLLDLICAPGFSTRDETDRASGRGVGMAVVKTTVEELNGTLALDTEPGAAPGSSSSCR